MCPQVFTLTKLFFTQHLIKIVLMEVFVLQCIELLVKPSESIQIKYFRIFLALNVEQELLNNKRIS